MIIILYNEHKNNVEGGSNMGWFSPKRNSDERIENVRNQIYKELWYIIFLICLGSVAFKVYKYGVGSNEIWLESLILLVGAIYSIIRSIQLGVFKDEVEMHDRHSKISMRKKNFIYSLVLSLIMALMMGVNSALSYASDGQEELEFFLISFFASIVIYLPLFLVLFVVLFEWAMKIKRNNEE